MPKGGNGGNGGGGSGSIRGNKRDNQLTGTENADLIEGLGGDDILAGLGGDDTLNGGAGSDSLDGGDGFDIAEFGGLRDDYVVTRIDATTVEIAGPDGSVDTVTNVESFVFADMTQSFSEVIAPRDPNLTAGTVTLSGASVIEGGAVNVDWEIGSNGIVDADSSSTHFVIATSPDMGSVVTSFGSAATGAIATGTSLSFSGALETDGMAPGTYYVAAVADTGDVLAESDETDNVSGWVEFTIVPEVVAYSIDAVEVLPSSDLDLNTDPDTNEYGARLDLSVTIRNSGNSGPTAFVVETYLSADTTLSVDDINISADYLPAGYGETVVDVAPTTT